MKQSKTVVLEEKDWRIIDHSRGQKSRSAYIEWCIKNADKYEDPRAIIKRHIKVIGLLDADLKGLIDGSTWKHGKEAHGYINKIHDSISLIIETALNNIE